MRNLRPSCDAQSRRRRDHTVLPVFVRPHEDAAELTRVRCTVVHTDATELPKWLLGHTVCLQGDPFSGQIFTRQSSYRSVPNATHSATLGHGFAVGKIGPPEKISS
jgi:hypothetical protein